MINNAHILRYYGRTLLDTQGSNSAFSGLNRSDDNNLLYKCSCIEVLMSCERHLQNIMKIPLYLKDATGSKKSDLHVSFIIYVSK